MKVIVDVDDVRPEIGFGGGKFEDPLKYLKLLNEELGTKFTLFVPANWEEKFNLREHKEWCDWIKSFDWIEIQNHGLTHTNPDKRFGCQEFLGKTSKEIEEIIKESQDIFYDVGIKPTGIRPPGWGIPNEAYKIIKDSKFEFIADHFCGTKPVQMSNKLYRIPHTFSINNIDGLKRDYVIIHSHINGRNDNDWNDKWYQEVRNYFLKYKDDLEFLTMSELVKVFK